MKADDADGVQQVSHGEIRRGVARLEHYPVGAVACEDRRKSAGRNPRVERGSGGDRGDARVVKRRAAAIEPRRDVVVRGDHRRARGLALHSLGIQADRRVGQRAQRDGAVKPAVHIAARRAKCAVVGRERCEAERGFFRQ